MKKYRVKITGKAKRPMFYEMKNTESISTLLKYAGGFAGDILPIHQDLSLHDRS